MPKTRALLPMRGIAVTLLTAMLIAATLLLLTGCPFTPGETYVRFTVGSQTYDWGFGYTAANTNAFCSQVTTAQNTYTFICASPDVFVYDALDMPDNYVFITVVATDKGTYSIANIELGLGGTYYDLDSGSITIEWYGKPDRMVAGTFMATVNETPGPGPSLNLTGGELNVYRIADDDEIPPQL